MLRGISSIQWRNRILVESGRSEKSSRDPRESLSNWFHVWYYPPWESGWQYTKLSWSKWRGGDIAPKCSQLLTSLPFTPTVRPWKWAQTDTPKRKRESLPTIHDFRCKIAVSFRDITPWKIKMEPTAITHEKKGQRSEPNAHDYVPVGNLPGCSILNHQEFLCFTWNNFFCHPGLKVQYLEIFS